MTRNMVLGLLAVTFFIGRVIPIDPVLAIVGDRAPEHVIARVREVIASMQGTNPEFVLLTNRKPFPQAVPVDISDLEEDLARPD